MPNIAVFIGEPLNFKDKIKIYPPSLREVITNPKFSIYQKILTITQEDIQDELKKMDDKLENYPTPYEFLLGNCYNSDEFKKLVVEAFQFFCRTNIVFLFNDKKILIGDLETLAQEINSISELKYLLEEEYFEFQNMIRESLGEKQVKPPEPIDPDEDPRIRRIKEKARERDRIKTKQSGKGGISLDTCVTAICCMGIGLTPLNIGELSYAAVSELMAKYQDKEKFEIDIASLHAGANPKKVQPKYWIKNNE